MTIEDELAGEEEAAMKVSPSAYNLLRPLLAKGKGKISIIAHNPEEQYLADNLALLLNYQREKELG